MPSEASSSSDNNVLLATAVALFATTCVVCIRGNVCGGAKAKNATGGTKLIAQELRLASKESNNMIQREPHFLVV